MAKLSPNASCPCGSGKKYKQCCRRFHQGAVAKDALELMKSRYSAYAARESAYIIKTTHPNNPDFSTDTREWKKSIESFCKNETFDKLEILEYIESKNEATVKFIAYLGSGQMKEKSRFVKEGGKWLYLQAL